MNYIFLAVVVLAGAGIPVQFAANKRLDDACHSPALAITLAFLIGTLVMAALTLTGLFGRGTLAGLSYAPWWSWIGGFVSVTVVLASIVALPKAGSEAVVAATVVGQLAAAVVLDHFGWLGMTKQPLNAARVAGTVLLVAGALLVQKK